MELLKIIPEVESSNLVEDMRLELDLFVVTAAKFGVDVVPYGDPALLHFQKVPAAIQKVLLHAARVYRVICEEFFREEIFVERDQIELLAKKAKIQISKDYLDNIVDGDVVEIYDSNSSQLFRTINFFRVCSYTLEELYSIPWYELYHRDQFFQKQNESLMIKMVTEKISGPQAIPVKPHHVEELRSKRMYRVLMQPKYMSRLDNSQGEMIGYASSFRVIEFESGRH